MRYRLVRTFSLLAVLLLAAVPRLAAQETGTLSGTVTDAANGRAMAGVRVDVVGADRRVAGSSTTDALGGYRFTGLRPGNYTLVILSGGDGGDRRLAAVVAAGRNATVNATVSGGNVLLNPLVVSASKRPEKALEAPARVEVVSEREIEERPTTTPAEHLRGIAGVDIAQSGVQSANVVARGFNNIFSGALHALTDYRIAGVPSLRVNLLQFVAANNEDIQRMEVVLGPGAALYGPNTADGILHILTKSPLDEQGTTVVLGGGARSTFQGEFRTSQLLASNFGVKVSGQYLRADEWRYVDPAEVAEQQKFANDPTGFYRADLMRAAGISAADAAIRIARIGNRDYNVERWAGEVRADWQAAPDLTAVFSAGVTKEVNGIELTGLGAGQAKDWQYSYFQARASWRRLFAQAYTNRSNAGGTFLLRNGAPIVDRSNIVVGQLQHGFDLGTRQKFTYGADMIRTTPITNGTINGLYENHDQTQEYGAYLQSETALHPKLDLVLAGRVDFHSALPDPIFSPRAALVFKPAPGHALRLTYNRAFSTPSSLNQFLDLGSSIPNLQLAQLGYSLRIQGTGETGFGFQDATGGYLVRSPFTPAGLGGPGTLLPGNSTTLFPLAVGVLAARAAQAGTPLPGSLVAYLSSLHPTAAQVGLNYLNVVTGQTGALSTLNLPDVKPIRESTSNTLEVGYKGILGSRLLVAADAWWSRKQHLVTPLTIQTPLVLLNGPQLGAYLVPRFMADLGYSQAQAQALAAQLIGSATAPGLATIPVAVISSADVHANGGQLLVTYVNVDENIDVNGADLSAKFLVSPVFSLGASGSWVSDDRWQTQNAGLVTLNAPTRKATLTAGYDNVDGNGLNAEVRMRYTSGFPVNSGVYIGTLCLGGTQGALAEACVKSYTLFDANAGYRLPGNLRHTTLQLSVTNLFNESYRPFPGTPKLGRMVLARVKYDF
ncbi:MAG TPA: TonB-dependent receptor [Longimicrobium sp.]|jgi:iron complex outermembrane receptor protein|nr:TonB-dependent receptor [Longimicrobium sp.]